MAPLLYLVPGFQYFLWIGEEWDKLTRGLNLYGCPTALGDLLRLQPLGRHNIQC